MIPVTLQDGTNLLLNPDRIETVQETPDTIVTMADGKRLIVRERAYELAERFRSYQRSLHVVDTRFGGRRETDPPRDDDPALYGNPNRINMRQPGAEDR